MEHTKNNENEQENTINTDKNEVHPPEIDATSPDPLEKIQALLGQASADHKVALHRLEPSWCSGYLETIPVSEENPLDLDHIASLWGGTKFRLRLLDGRGKYVANAIIDMRSWPPRHLGVTLKEPREKMLEALKADETSSPIAPPAVPAPTGPSTAEILQLLSQQRQSDLELIGKMIATQTAPASAPAPSPAHDMIGMIRAMGEMREILGSTGGGSEDPFGALERIAKLWLQGKQKSARSGREQALTAGEKGSTMEKESSAAAGHELASRIAQLPPTEAAEALIGAIGLMPGHSREETIDALDKMGAWDLLTGDDEDHDEIDTTSKGVTQLEGSG